MTERKHLDYIDGLKGVAILMVLFFHVSLTASNKPFFQDFRNQVEHLSRGVHLFFLISGFSLFHSSTSNWDFYKWPLLSFYTKRMFRILPLWWLTVILYHFFWSTPHPTSSFLATIFLYFGFYLNAWTICIVPVGWSLFVEESFYIFFPLWRRILTNWVFALLSVIVSYVVAVLWFHYGGRYFRGLHFLSIFPLGNYYAFFLGILLFQLNRLLQFDSEAFQSKLKLSMINLSCLFGLLLIFNFDQMVGTLGLTPFFFSAFFSKSFFGKIVRLRLIKKFGVYCYSIYLFHGPLLMLFSYLQSRFFLLIGLGTSYSEVQTFAWFIIVAGASLVLGKISYFLFELSSIALGKRLIQTLENKS